jgi:hypothetical protein
MGGCVGGVCAEPDQDEGLAPIGISSSLPTRLDVVHQQTTKKLVQTRDEKKKTYLWCRNQIVVTRTWL